MKTIKSIRKCYACKQPINYKMYQIGMTPPLMWQHFTDLNARWYNPLDQCPKNIFFKGLNRLIAVFKQYNPNGWHGTNRDTGESI